MLTKDDLMKLSKERLCELLLEEWSKKENTLKPFDFPSLGRDDCYHGGPCTNPFHDCIDCPRLFSGNGTTISTDGTNLQPLNK
jgi:hypothetical protein